MPRIAGRNLNEVFDLARDRAGGWSLTRALLALGKLCDVMAYAHSRGVIHRDLKPTNVMLGGFGEIYVVDWGLAKWVAEDEPATRNGSRDAADALPGETLDGTVAGTPPYLAPEQALGRVGKVSYGADIYAIGAILHRLLAGVPPYISRRGRDDPAAMLALIRRGPPTPLRRIAPKAPRELVSICEKAMAWRLEDRYASVDELVRDLDAFVEDRVTGARRGGFWSEAKERLLRRQRAPDEKGS
jgi:serine/threonine protein kinase